MEWISVDKELPEKESKVLCCFERSIGINRGSDFNVETYYWNDYWEKSGITHWMPLPEPPNQD